MISVNLYGEQCRLELEMDDIVKNLMWITIFSGKRTQFTACSFDWQDWYVKINKICNPSLVALGCGAFALNDETDAAVVKQFLEGCKNGC